MQSFQHQSNTDFCLFLFNINHHLSKLLDGISLTSLVKRIKTRSKAKLETDP